MVPFCSSSTAIVDTHASKPVALYRLSDGRVMEGGDWLRPRDDDVIRKSLAHVDSRRRSLELETAKPHHAIDSSIVPLHLLLPVCLEKLKYIEPTLNGIRHKSLETSPTT